MVIDNTDYDNDDYKFVCQTCNKKLSIKTMTALSIAKRHLVSNRFWFKNYFCEMTVQQ
jgi:transposase-like protein